MRESGLHESPDLFIGRIKKLRKTTEKGYLKEKTVTLRSP